MKNVRQTNINTHRDAWVEINLENLEHNVKEIRKNVPADTKLLGVVKADAYGHGAVMLAPVILASGIDMLGVASIDEGVDLRNAKIGCDILVLGAVPVWAVESAVAADLSIAVFSKDHIEACRLAYERTGVKPKIHVKIDTGMNRIGVSVEEAVDFIKQVQNCDFIDFKGVFTHLAAAEEREQAAGEQEVEQAVGCEPVALGHVERLILHFAVGRHLDTQYFAAFATFDDRDGAADGRDETDAFFVLVYKQGLARHHVRPLLYHRSRFHSVKVVRHEGVDLRRSGFVQLLLRHACEVQVQAFTNLECFFHKPVVTCANLRNKNEIRAFVT